MQKPDYAKLEERLFPKQDGYFARRKGFWERQLQHNPTRSQQVYDAIFGIVAPILVFIFDPIVFCNNFSDIDEGFLGRYKFLVYLISAIALTTLGLWLVGLIKKQTAIVSGILFSGAICSFTIGVVILPLSVFGLLLFGIGIFGFIPFLTTIVFWRNAKRALDDPKHITYKKSQGLSVILGMLLTIGLPLTIDFTLSQLVSSSFQVLLSQTAEAQEKEEAATRIRQLSWYLDKDKLIDDFEAEQDQARKAALAQAFELITNVNIRVARSD